MGTCLVENEGLEDKQETGKSDKNGIVKSKDGQLRRE